MTRSSRAILHTLSGKEEFVTQDTRLPLKAPARWPDVLIGIGKLCKAVGLLALGFGVQQLLSPAHHEALRGLVEQVHPHNQYLYFLLGKALAIPEATLRMLRVGFFVYSGLYAIEGIGLLADRPWAEWMVVVTTAGFIPIEAREIYLHITWVRCLVMALNLFVVSYLCFRLYRRHQIKRAAKDPGPPVVANAPVSHLSNPADRPG
jgi:uncharacterized membrane protein (DUF2068 family)